MAETVATALAFSAAASEARQCVGSSGRPMLKRITRKLGIEEQRLGLAPQEVKLLEIPEGDRRNGTKSAELLEPTAGFGEVSLSRVGQRQVSPIGGVILELRLLRGGRSLVQSGDRLIDPAS